MYQDYNLIIHMYHSLPRLLTCMSLLQVFLKKKILIFCIIWNVFKLFFILQYKYLPYCAICHKCCTCYRRHRRKKRCDSQQSRYDVNCIWTWISILAQMTWMVVALWAYVNKIWQICWQCMTAMRVYCTHAYIMMILLLHISWHSMTDECHI